MTTTWDLNNLIAPIDSSRMTEIDTINTDLNLIVVTLKVILLIFLP